MENKFLARKAYCIVGALLILVLAMVSPFLTVVSISEKAGGLLVDVRYSGTEIFFDSEGLTFLWMYGFAFSAIFSVISVFASDVNVKEKKLETAIAILLFSSFLFFCNGLIEMDLARESFSEENVSVTIRTATWVPLILVSLIAVGYFICKYLINREKANTKGFNKFSFYLADKKEEVKNEPTIVEMLVKYKELLDNGIITEDEYYSIKEKILKD